MYDQYDSWNIVKKRVSTTRRNEVYFRERDIWHCSIGLNVGDEEYGKGPDFSRPILVLKKFSRYLFWGIPLSSKNKTGIFYGQIVLKNGSVVTALLSHLRLFDARRLQTKLERISEMSFDKIKQATRLLI